MPLNYTTQDVFGSFLAIILFSLVFVFPGYVIGWWLNLFEFRKQLRGIQIMMGITLSNAFSPIILFLIYRFTSSGFAIGLLLLFAGIGIGLYFWQSQNKSEYAAMPLQSKKYQQLFFAMIALWVIFSIFLLVDVQIGKRLYFTANSYDLTTRVAVVDAITRTGVPPINPSYYPGHPVPLTFLYYFWYILGSVVDQLGGAWVSAYHAMIASISWCGITIVATVATYLRLRNNVSQLNIWRKSIMAIQFFAVGGLDFVMVTMIMISIKVEQGYIPFEGRVEGWNMPIMSWINAVAWVPHHVAAALACITALMILVYYAKSVWTKKLVASILIGLAFASSFGLSVWVMFVFAVFWGVWTIFMLFQKHSRKLVWWMVLGGVLGLILSSPFLAGLFHPSESSLSGGGLPIALYVRPFMLSHYLTSLPQIVFYGANLLFLPLNYLFEFGFFFITTTIWIESYFRKNNTDYNQYYLPELILVSTTVFLMSFFYSNIIAINDLGIRGWLPMQFVIVIWATDVAEKLKTQKIIITPKMFGEIKVPKRLGAVLGGMLVIGLLTTLLEIASLRTWTMLIDLSVVGFPNELSVDTSLGSRTYSSRLAFDYLRDQIPANFITQSNPLETLDRPGGLYGTHQMVIADRTAYGVPTEVFNNFVKGVGVLFTNRNVSSWQSIDELCQHYLIDILIYKDTDPIWNSLSILKTQRAPLYENTNYAVFACGSHSFSPYTP
jgi:hypothetical protein